MGKFVERRENGPEFLLAHAPQAYTRSHAGPWERLRGGAVHHGLTKTATDGLRVRISVWSRAGGQNAALIVIEAHCTNG